MYLIFNEIPGDESTEHVLINVSSTFDNLSSFMNKLNIHHSEYVEYQKEYIKIIVKYHEDVRNAVDTELQIEEPNYRDISMYGFAIGEAKKLGPIHHLKAINELNYSKELNNQLRNEYNVKRKAANKKKLDVTNRISTEILEKLNANDMNIITNIHNKIAPIDPEKLIIVVIDKMDIDISITLTPGGFETFKYVNGKLV